MSLRPPSGYSGSRSGSGHGPAGFASPVDHEIANEKAIAIGRAGDKVQESLRMLAEAPDDRREEKLMEAARAVHAYFIQRELCGMRKHAGVIREYGIPRAVLARLGAS